MTASVSAAARPETADKHAALHRWVRRHVGEVTHEERVEKLALTLFALTRPHHHLGMPERNLLALAALVHDVGRSLEDDDHEMHGAAMLQVADELPLTDAERRRLMFLTRYHRGPVDAAGKEDHLRPADDRETLRTLLSLLRAADALDSRYLDSPQIALTLRGQTLAITCYLQDVSPKILRKLTRKKKFLLLEETLGLRVAVTVHQVTGVALVA
jgi:exopolyphosphatase / guanosine-5'-triphosphate,3'-diphosphate pyrophosphatase